MVTDKEKNTCTGCTACVNVCPKNCITMKRDVQGFLYPSIERELCIECGACDRICAETVNRAEGTDLQKGFGAVAKDRELQLNSSSGGVFTLLCNEVFSRGGLVFGVTMSADCREAAHRAADNSRDAAGFRGAKYLQSNVGESFEKVREILNAGKEVLFSGTPCQVDGLKAFIKENDEKLLCVDMICHGVPSPLVWKKYCSEIEEKYKGKISSVNFRYKKYSWEKPNVNSSKNSKAVFQSKTEDPYMRLFLSDYTLRPSCYACTHKGISRKSDITIADFWGVDKVAPGFSDGAGTSLVIIHTEKGLRYFEKISDFLRIQEVDVLKACERNGAALRSAEKPAELDKFWGEMPNSSTEKLADTYTPAEDAFKSKLKKTAVYGILKKSKKVNMENGICFVIDR